MINAGKYNKKISIYSITNTKDADGFPIRTRNLVLTTWASVKTTRGYTLIKNNSDFEKAYTNFTIRYPKSNIERGMEIDFNNKVYVIQYPNNVNEEGIELEMQAKEVMH